MKLCFLRDSELGNLAVQPTEADCSVTTFCRGILNRRRCIAPAFHFCYLIHTKENTHDDTTETAFIRVPVKNLGLSLLKTRGMA